MFEKDISKIYTRLPQERPLFIGITGASGSGKSFFAKNLLSCLDKKKLDVATLNLDNYYLGKTYVNKYLQGNFDTIKAIDTKLLAKHLSLLKQNKEIDMPIYDFNVSERKGYSHFLPHKILILEGLFVFLKPVVNFLDYKIFIDSDLNICYKRRLKRDIEERGRNKTDVDNKWKKALEFYKKELKNKKSLADYIVQN